MGFTFFAGMICIVSVAPVSFTQRLAGTTYFATSSTSIMAASEEEEGVVPLDVGRVKEGKVIVEKEKIYQLTAK